MWRLLRNQEITTKTTFEGSQKEPRIQNFDVSRGLATGSPSLSLAESLEGRGSASCSSGEGSPFVREKARSTIPSNIGISESPGKGFWMSPKLRSQRCDMSRFAEASREGLFIRA